MREPQVHPPHPSPSTFSEIVPIFKYQSFHFINLVCVFFVVTMRTSQKFCVNLFLTLETNSTTNHSV